MLFVIQSLLSILHGIMFGTDIVNFVTYLLFYTCLKYLFCFVPSSWVIAIHRFCINSSSLGISFGCNGDIYFLLFAFWQDSCMALTSLPLRRCQMVHRDAPAATVAMAYSVLGLTTQSHKINSWWYYNIVQLERSCYYCSTYIRCSAMLTFAPWGVKCWINSLWVTVVKYDIAK